MAKKTTTHSSGKAGVRSRGQKLAGSRHGLEPHPASRKKAGAYGQEDGRKRKAKTPGTASKRGQGGAIAKMKARRA